MQPSRRCWQQHKLTIGNLIIEEEARAKKDWERVCIVDETFRWASMESPFAVVAAESIGVARQDGFDSDTGQSTMVVLSRAHFGSFRRALEELSAGSLWLRMQAMGDGQDRFVQYITEEAQRMEAASSPSAVVDDDFCSPARGLSLRCSGCLSPLLRPARMFTQ
eukprot:CAMPEP_0174310230 /NCGR_PEP_ID=MMETSP0810-20121108/2919_1 /TAXON_ID=73025 ORGANISM="Eutreptiella gymnastica-like, Strain CCMP1594" /NCGR_SAMPLE_ID=MMETSP0810 /ASSEMBLY_ACC=CAM_ASM_000659 /LENGTH=163 /DNA_ID=CAMNT_0015418089 /DNA_START=216 /DNA_END=708 /DNA_ORIENTATION=-